MVEQPAFAPVGDEPSQRLVEQRVRNRMMEEIWRLSLGDAGVAQSGPTEWFLAFFDWFPKEGEPHWFPAMTPEEIGAVGKVCKLMQAAIADTDISNQPTVEEITLTGWPKRLAPVAKEAIDLMLRRGLFSEEVEEAEPSSPTSWP